MIKAVLFDLDNTLLDFVKMKNMSVEAAVGAMIDAGLPMKKEKALKVLWDLYDDYGIEYGNIMQKFLEEVLGKIDWKILARGIIAYRRVKSGFLEPYPHVIPTLIKLKEKGYKLAVVSDAPRLRAWLRLAAMKITDFFDVVITIDDAKGRPKPDPLPYRMALQKLKLRPEECVFVGDNTNRDVTGAKSIGMMTVLAKYGEWSKPGKSARKPDYEITDISQLLNIMERIK